MPSPIPQQAIDSITRAKGAEASAVTALGTVKSKIDAAVAAALENGATAEELQPVKDVSDALDEQTNLLAAAIAANP